MVGMTSDRCQEFGSGSEARVSCSDGLGKVGHLAGSIVAEVVALEGQPGDPSVVYGLVHQVQGDRREHGGHKRVKAHDELVGVGRACEQLVHREIQILICGIEEIGDRTQRDRKFCCFRIVQSRRTAPIGLVPSAMRRNL